MDAKNNIIKVKDSYSFIFPVFYTGKLGSNDDFFGLTNYIISLKEKNKDLTTMQIYPPNKYLIRKFLPSKLIKMDNLIYSQIFRRLIFVKCYSSNDDAIIKEFLPKSNQYINKNYMRNLNHEFEKKIYSKFSQLIKNQKNFIPLKFFHRPRN